MMYLTDEHRKLCLEMGSGDKNIRDAAYRSFKKLGGNNPAFYISLLSLGRENSHVRNAAAYALRDIGDPVAKEPLWEYVLDADNIGWNGSMMYALAAFDNNDRFLDVFGVLFYHDAEAKMGAQSLLEEGVFDFNSDDLTVLRKMWQECRLNRGGCFLDEQWERSIQSTVDSFLSYSKDEQ
jgi:hypothetical protein